ncbi:hypothetical protein RFI_24169 [Reticulomyxa filosa]|uniref:Uncharacterized protein n=1 Tax=Reticulomyxa filosa TaxID=46433 RepID=X6MJG1_RETFI|nr:hypothetical protein RFI_24169 [Reticulomyxa filosa]|eukprot:ETO13205.1 hypothetical protein RFI_24169 [Reticulomyxa filosa]
MSEKTKKKYLLQVINYKHQNYQFLQKNKHFIFFKFFYSFRSNYNYGLRHKQIFLYLYTGIRFYCFLLSTLDTIVFDRLRIEKKTLKFFGVVFKGSRDLPNIIAMIVRTPLKSTITTDSLTTTKSVDVTWSADQPQSDILASTFGDEAKSVIETNEKAVIASPLPSTTGDASNTGLKSKVKQGLKQKIEKYNTFIKAAKGFEKEQKYIEAIKNFEQAVSVNVCEGSKLEKLLHRLDELKNTCIDLGLHETPEAFVVMDKGWRKNTITNDYHLSSSTESGPVT